MYCDPELKGTTLVAQTEHELYRSRKAIRHFVSYIAGALLLLFVADRLFRSSTSPVVHVVLLFAGFGLIVFLNWIVEQQCPDPDPAETKRLNAAMQKARLAEAAVRDEKRAAQKLVDDANRAEREKKRAEEKAVREKEAFELRQRAEAAEPVITAILENEAAMGITSARDKKVFRLECLVHLYEINPGMAVLIGLGWDIFVELEVKQRAMEKEAERQKRVAAAANVLSAGESSYRFLKKYMK
jgi:hypothetical protein